MMNSVSPASPSPLPFVAASPDGAAGAAVAADGPPAFAKALDRAAQARDSQADQPSQHTLRDDTEPDAPSTSTAERVARGKRTQRTPPTQPRERVATQAHEAAEEGLARADSKAVRQPQDDTPGDSAAQALLDLAVLLAGLAPAKGTAATGEAADKSTHDDTAASRTVTQQRSGKAPAAQAETVPAQGLDMLIAARQGSESGASTPAVDAVVAAASLLRDGGSTRQVFDSAIGGPLAQVAGAAPTAPSAPIAGGEPATMFKAELAAALGTPEFAPALGSQVSVLIRDGVSQAQLRLNPADMGPIEVRIRLDGDYAQVDFSALQAMTRQALEEAVPALASALRESGLTLSGGGVFEQAHQPQGERETSRGTGAPPPSGDAADTLTRHSARAPAWRARGMVDLYA